MEITQWEHKRIPGQSQIEELGNQGWEAVGFNSNGSVLLKRPCGTVDINVKEPSNNNTQLLEKLIATMTEVNENLKSIKIDINQCQSKEKDEGYIGY